MIIGALGTVLVWRFGLTLTSVVYDAMPATIVGFMVYFGDRIVFGKATSDDST